MYDAVVVGLGPAGSSCAYTLAKAGMKVLALDKAVFPRYKSCGGCVSTKIENILDFDISSAVEQTVYGATFTYKSERPVDILSSRVVGMNVMRDNFDALLVDKAVGAGAEVIYGARVNGITDDAMGVTVTTSCGRSVRGRYVIGADGAGGFVGRHCFGLNPKQSAVSITAEVPYDRGSFPGIEKKLFIDFGTVPFGYAWIFPKKEYLSVGMAADTARIGGGIKDYFNTFVKEHPALKGMNIAKKDGWMVPIFYFGAKKAVNGNVALAGDTGHLVDPFLGEGIYYAVLTGSQAAKAVIAGLKTGCGLSSYQAWLEDKVYPEFKAAEKLSDLVYKHPRLWYRIVEKDTDIMQRYYNVVRGEESAAAFYAWAHGKVRGKPWKLLWRWISSRMLAP